MVIFLHGDDTFRSREKLRSLTEKFLREVDPSGANLVTMDGATATATELWGAIAAQSFLVRKRMVIVEDSGAAKSPAVREEVAGFLDRIPEDAIVVFWEGRTRNGERGTENAERRTRKRTTKSSPEKTAAAKRDPLFPKLLAGKFAQEFVPLEGAQRAAWVRERAGTLGVTVAPDALAALVQEVGSDLWRMTNTLAQLAAAAAASGGTVITAAHVRALVPEAPPEDVFAFVDAVANGDRALALRHLRALEAARVDPFPLVGLLARQVRLCIAAADLLGQGVAAHALAAELGVQPFVAARVAAQARRANPAQLRRVHLRLVELDAKLKSSRAPWEALLECFTLDATRA